ncbi:MAG: tRNA(His) guanylyltransferase Thg1 family protein [Bacilli bacterium]|nr:tRNA(His) guanylyltransferase Thg1 family protein [Bacilli bacterium]
MEQKSVTQHDYNVAEEEFKYYIRESDYLLRNDESIIVHIDGANFSKHTNKLSNDNKRLIFQLLVATAKSVIKEFRGAKLGYVCCDEISILLDGKYIEFNDSNRIQKILSRSVSLTTLIFNQLLYELERKEKEQLSDFVGHTTFSAKCYNLPIRQVNNYFKWRLLACKKAIFDKHEKYEKQEDWKKYGTVLLFDKNDWEEKSVDFETKKFYRQPQNDYYQLG